MTEDFVVDTDMLFITQNGIAKKHKLILTENNDKMLQTCIFINV